MDSIGTNDWTWIGKAHYRKGSGSPDGTNPANKCAARRRFSVESECLMKSITLAAVVPLLLIGCVAHRDIRTQTELDRDSEIWTRAHGVRVAVSPDQLKDCSPLGVVSERSYDGPPGDPAKRPMGAAWPEYVLKFKTAQLGGNAALVCAPIKKWSGQLNERRVLGEAYLCGEPVLTTAFQGFRK
jgi:hypothetical protein